MCFFPGSFLQIFRSLGSHFQVRTWVWVGSPTRWFWWPRRPVGAERASRSSRNICRLRCRCPSACLADAKLVLHLKSLRQQVQIITGSRLVFCATDLQLATHILYFLKFAGSRPIAVRDLPPASFFFHFIRTNIAASQIMSLVLRINYPLHIAPPSQ